MKTLRRWVWRPRTGMSSPRTPGAYSAEIPAMQAGLLSGRVSSTLADPFPAAVMRGLWLLQRIGGVPARSDLCQRFIGSVDAGRGKDCRWATLKPETVRIILIIPKLLNSHRTMEGDAIKQTRPTVCARPPPRKRKTVGKNGTQSLRTPSELSLRAPSKPFWTSPSFDCSPAAQRADNRFSINLPRRVSRGRVLVRAGLLRVAALRDLAVGWSIPL